MATPGRREFIDRHFHPKHHHRRETKSSPAYVHPLPVALNPADIIHPHSRTSLVESMMVVPLPSPSSDSDHSSHSTNRKTLELPPVIFPMAETHCHDLHTTKGEVQVNQDCYSTDITTASILFTLVSDSIAMILLPPPPPPPPQKKSWKSYSKPSRIMMPSCFQFS